MSSKFLIVSAILFFDLFLIDKKCCAKYKKCMSPARLSRRELAIVEAISRIAFVNPFSEERQKFDRELSSLFGSDAALPLSWREPLELWAASLPPEKTRWTNYRDKERELMRIACLFLVYERFLPDLDSLIQKEAEQEKTQPVRFAEACLRRMEEAGFERDDAIRFFSIFYQLRRGHHFIVHGLKGISPCMQDFRPRLWNNVFTSNVRWYDEFLWDKMEDFSTMFAGETGTGKGDVYSSMELQVAELQPVAVAVVVEHLSVMAERVGRPAGDVSIVLAR